MKKNRIGFLCLDWGGLWYFVVFVGGLWFLCWWGVLCLWLILIILFSCVNYWLSFLVLLNTCVCLVWIFVGNFLLWLRFRWWLFKVWCWMYLFKVWCRFLSLEYRWFVFIIVCCGSILGMFDLMGTSLMKIGWKDCIIGVGTGFDFCVGESLMFFVVMNWSPILTIYSWWIWGMGLVVKVGCVWYCIGLWLVISLWGIVLLVKSKSVFMMSRVLLLV